MAAAASLDGDRFDALCTHYLVEESATGALVGCFRMLVLDSGAEIGKSYSAQFYDLARLHGFHHPIAEIGRFCVHPQRHDSAIVRLAWAAIVARIDAEDIKMIFGCSSFVGTDPSGYIGAFAALKAHHVAPARWSPAVRASEVFRFADVPHDTAPDSRQIPSLLRSYLGMGGWVSDHAVVDHQLGTLHVFTGMQVARIPPVRLRLLRATGRSSVVAEVGR